MAQILVKMSIQNVSFSQWSPSAIVASSFLCAIDMLKNSTDHDNDRTKRFCDQARMTIIRVTSEDKSFLKDKDYINQLNDRIGGQKTAA